MAVQKKVAEALGMAIPEEDQNDDPMTTEITVVEPHEIIIIDNADLPDTSDIEKKIIEGEKQLEELITRGLSAFKESYNDMKDIEPKHKGRFLEVVATLYGHTKDALAVKLEFQAKRIKLRMDQAAYKGKGTKGTTGTATKDAPTNVTQVFFSGNREDLRRDFKAMFENGQEPPAA